MCANQKFAQLLVRLLESGTIQSSTDSREVIDRPRFAPVFKNVNFEKVCKRFAMNSLRRLTVTKLVVSYSIQRYVYNASFSLVLPVCQTTNEMLGMGVDGYQYRIKKCLRVSKGRLHLIVMRRALHQQHRPAVLASRIRRIDTLDYFSHTEIETQITSSSHIRQSH